MSSLRASRRAQYYSQIHSKLRSLGFKEDTSQGAPLCRWKLNELIVDVMPPVRDVLGFSNRWYLHAIDTAIRVAIPAATDVEPIEIRLVTGPSFLATKLDAFAGRGGDDYVSSRHATRLPQPGKVCARDVDSPPREYLLGRQNLDLGVAPGV